MIGLAAITTGLAFAVIAITICLLALLVRALRSLDLPYDSDDWEPAWWPELERGLADYVAARDSEGDHRA